MIRVLIVDDEPLARRGVKVCLRRAADVVVIGEAESGQDALDKLDTLTPDLIFLDIQMPGMNGFELLARLSGRTLPLIVFLTAYDTYALDAFAVHALDYVMKPIDDHRFDEALGRARQRLQERRAGEQLADIRRLLAADAAPVAARLSRFEVKTGGRTVWISADEVDWIEASGDYVVLHAGTRSYMVQGTMDGIEQALDPAKFARIHRSTIVASDRVRSFSLLPTRDAVISLKDGVELRVSRRFRHRLRMRETSG
jgi:two-component system LytT family response regulator